MNGKKRSRFEMYIDVLEACTQPTILTRMMYATNINCTDLKKMLEHLITNNVIEKIPIMPSHKTKVDAWNRKMQEHPKMRNPSRYAYKLTPNGRELLGNIQRAIRPLQLITEGA